MWSSAAADWAKASSEGTFVEPVDTRSTSKEYFETSFLQAEAVSVSLPASLPPSRTVTYPLTSLDGSL